MRCQVLLIFNLMKMWEEWFTQLIIQAILLLTPVLPTLTEILEMRTIHLQGDINSSKITKLLISQQLHEEAPSLSPHQLMQTQF